MCAQPGQMLFSKKVATQLFIICSRGKCDVHLTRCRNACAGQTFVTQQQCDVKLLLRT